MLILVLFCFPAKMALVSGADFHSNFSFQALVCVCGVYKML